ncbi:MAG TPA: DinB family protein [Mycobacteriales bacterium]|nr:DinB family protein [Mycobacteriales bacterium]
MSIEPDTKDWTWVLRERCPECGFESWTFPREQIGSMVRTVAARWLTVLQRPDARTRPDPSTWSPLEYACHVRDVFRIYDERLHLMLDHDDPLFANWDQDQTAREDRYEEQAPEVVASQLSAAADTVADSFDDVTEEGWGRTGRRSDGSNFTIESMGRYFAHDWIHHLWDVGADHSSA